MSDISLVLESAREEYANKRFDTHSFHVSELNSLLTRSQDAGLVSKIEKIRDADSEEVIPTSWSSANPPKSLPTRPSVASKMRKLREVISVSDKLLATVVRVTGYDIDKRSGTAADRRIGTKIFGPNKETFHLDSYLGGGAFGKVYKASGLTSGITVAVKMAPEDKLSDPTTLAFRSVLNETRAEMLRINHENVVRVLYADSATDPKIGPYIIMEYVDGANLQKLLDERKLNSK